MIKNQQIQSSYSSSLNNLKKELQQNLLQFNYISSELLINNSVNSDWECSEGESLNSPNTTLVEKTSSLISSKLDVIKEHRVVSQNIQNLINKYPYLIDLIYENEINTKLHNTVLRKTFIKSINDMNCNICFDEYTPDKYGVAFLDCGHSCCYTCFCSIKTPTCHMCRTNINKAVRLLHLKECVSIKITNNIIEILLNLIFFSSIDQISDKYNAPKILFNIPFALNISHNSLNEIILDYINTNIKVINPQIAAFFAAIYYSLHYHKNYQIECSNIYLYKKIDINILYALIQTPKILLNFIYIIHEFNNGNIIENLNKIVKNINININKFRSIFNNQIKKNLIKQIINNFKINESTCNDFFRNNRQFKIIFSHILTDCDILKFENLKLFNNYINGDKNNFYWQFLNQVRIRGIKEIKNLDGNNTILKLNFCKHHNKIFICTFKNIKFTLHANDIEQIYTEAKNFLFLNKSVFNIEDDNIIMQSSKYDYSINEFNENNIEIY
jgi:hypothetical protein